MTRASALWQRLRVLAVPTVVGTALIASPLVLASPAAAAPSPSDVQAQVTTLTKKLDTLNEQFNTAKVNLASVKAQQTQLNRQVSVTQTQLTTLTQKTASYAISAYKGGDVSMMSSMITSGSADTFLDQLTTLDALTSQSRNQLAALRTTKASLAVQQAKVNTLAVSAQGLVNTLTTSRTTYNNQLAALKKLLPNTDFSGTGSGNGPAPSAPIGAPTTVKFAYAQINEPYHMNGAGPDVWDCSGLTMMAYKQVGISLDHSAHRQYQQSPHISRSQVQAGDLVFFNDFGHVGIAINNSQVIHAPTEGEYVKITSISAMGFAGAARPS